MRRPRLLAAALAGLLGAATVPTAPLQAPTTSSVEAVATQTKSTPAPAPLEVTANQVLRHLGNVPFISYRNSGYIWQATAKRGNRRGRSRWNYNR